MRSALVVKILLEIALLQQFATTEVNAFVPSTLNNNKCNVLSTCKITKTTTALKVLSSPQPPQTQERNATSSIAKSSSTTTTSTTTPAPKYPTLRGSEVDSRKIIATGAGRQYLTAIRLAHILFASRDLAEASLHELRSSTRNFQELAEQISACSETRDKGGALGWISIHADDDKESPNKQQQDADEHLDVIFPKQARAQIVQITTKPGDIVLVESPRGFHLVQVLDVMADVRKMAFRKQRKKSSSSSSSSLKQTKTYLMETMGCQMNKADSERMEGQLQSLGIQPFDDTMSKKGEKPDVIVLNTCSIRDRAEQKVYSCKFL